MRVTTNLCAVIALACVGFAVGDWASHPNAVGMLGIMLLIGVFAFLLSYLFRPQTAGQSRARRAPAPAPPEPAHSAHPEEPRHVNVNRAGVKELSTLPGVSPTAAQRIVDEREAHGSFAAVADLARVPGFSPEKVRALSGRART